MSHKPTVTAPSHRTFYDNFAWKAKGLFWVGLLGQGISFLTEFAPIKFALQDTLGAFVGLYASYLSLIGGLVSAFIIEMMIRYGATTTTRSVLNGYFSGKPIEDGFSPGIDTPGEIRAGKMARFLAWLFLVVGISGIALSSTASYKGSVMIGERFIQLPSPDTIDNSADSAAITLAYVAFAADSAGIIAAAISTERALRRQADATKEPAARARLRADAAKAKADGQTAVIARTTSYRAETKAADRITKRIADRDQAHIEAVALAKAQGRQYGGGLAWLTLAFQLVSCLCLIFAEVLKKGAGQKDGLAISTYAFHGGLFSEAWEAWKERCNQVIRAKITAYKERTEEPVIFASGAIPDVTGLDSNRVIYTPKLEGEEEEAPRLKIAAKAAKVEPEVQRRTIGFHQGEPKSYAKGIEGNQDASTMREVKNKPPQKPGFYAVYEDRVVHAPTIPPSVYGSYPEQSPNFGFLKSFDGKTCVLCGVGFPAIPVWRKFCCEDCGKAYNNKTRPLRGKKGRKI